MGFRFFWTTFCRSCVYWAGKLEARNERPRGYALHHPDDSTDGPLGCVPWRWERNRPRRLFARYRRQAADHTGASWRDAWPRPVRLFLNPEPVETIALLPDHPPVSFTWRGVRRRVRRADGPERVFRRLDEKDSGGGIGDRDRELKRHQLSANRSSGNDPYRQLCAAKAHQRERWFPFVGKGSGMAPTTIGPQPEPACRGQLVWKRTS